MNGRAARGWARSIEHALDRAARLARELDLLLELSNHPESIAIVSRLPRPRTASRMSRAMTIDLRRLFDSGDPPALLVGAGISLDAPSNLLDGRRFLTEVLRRIAAPDIDPDWAVSILDLPETELRRPGEFLRFETLMGSLVQSELDSELHVLDCLDDCTHPNAHHFLLAALIRRGAVVMTTNFDRLIEIAYATLFDGQPALRVVCSDGDFDPRGPAATDAPTLWKLHGSLSVDGRSTRRSLQATITAAMAHSMSAGKRAFLARVLGDHDLLVAGYSGSDDLDLVPLLAATASSRRLLWVDHSAGAEVSIADARELLRSRSTVHEWDLVGRGRVFFFNEEEPKSWTRPPERKLLIRADTRRVMRCVRELFLPDLKIPSPRGAYDFAQSPTRVAEYFDRWAQLASRRPSARLHVFTGIFANRSFRAEDRRHLDRIEAKLHKRISARKAAPDDRVDRLVELFNREMTEEQRPARLRKKLDRIRFEVEALRSSVGERRRGLALRLLGCIAWELEGPAEGERAFREAIRLDRELGNALGELHTLTTWQHFCGRGGIRDHVTASENRRANELARVLGEPEFPDDAHARLRELAEQDGLQAILWEKLVDVMAVGYVEESVERVNALFDEARRMIRYCVDMGDVRGEARSRFLMGQILADDERGELATIHFVYVLELGRIVDLGEIGFRAGAYLNQLGTAEYAEQIRERIQSSLWNLASSAPSSSSSEQRA